MSEAETNSDRYESPNRFASAYTHTVNDRYGVKTPTVRHDAVNKAPTKNGCNEAIPERLATFSRNAAATETRSSSSPIPGPLGGNIENKRCTLAN